MADEKQKFESYSNLGGMNTKASPHTTGAFEFLKIINYDFSRPGSLTPVPGTTQFLGTTLSGRMSTIYEFERLNGFSQIILTANTNAYFVSGGVPIAFRTGLTNNAQFDFVSFVDRLFGANGQDFFRWDGTNVSNFSLPPGLTASWGATAVAGGSLFAADATVTVAYGYINDRGYMGPISNGITIALTVLSANSIKYYGLTAPAGYGISAIALFRTSPDGVDFFRTISLPPSTTQFTDTSLILTDEIAKPYLWFTLAPRYMDIVNNQLFCAGFSSLLSTICWSDIGEPEGIQAEWRNEVRTNDGDRIMGIKAFQGDGIVFKGKSITRFRANNPEDVQFSEISDQYGTLSDRSIVVYDSILLFLDQQGIIQYNGAEPTVLSTRISPVFESMNLDAAKEQSCAIHFKNRKEIWFAIPTGGATLNNTIVVYDYNVNAFYIRNGINPSHLAIMKGGTSSPRAFYSNYAGALFNFGASLVGDSGQGMTYLIQTRFVHDQGDTNEVLWRRLFLNCDPGSGATVAFNVNFFANYGNTVALSRTMYSNPFQTRIDFGVSSKSLSAEITQFSATHIARLDGFTFAYRFLRSV